MEQRHLVATNVPAAAAAAAAAAATSDYVSTGRVARQHGAVAKHPEYYGACTKSRIM
jgi:hypothetical protein